LTRVKFSHNLFCLAAGALARSNRKTVTCQRGTPLKKPYVKPAIGKIEDSSKARSNGFDITPFANPAMPNSLDAKRNMIKEASAMPQENYVDPLISVSADVVSAYISNNRLPAADLPVFIAQIYASFKTILAGASSTQSGELNPAVPIKKSVTPNFIICLEDGRHFKSLKRHIAVHYGLSPDQYRAKWNLPANYPMVAPNYSANRSRLAKSMGLGRKPNGSAR